MKSVKTIAAAVAVMASVIFAGCTGEELLLHAYVSVAERTPVEVDGILTLEVPISTSNFWIQEAYVEVSTNSDMNDPIMFTIDDAIFHDGNQHKTYTVEFTGLEFSTEYYYRVVVAGFTGNDKYSGEKSRISFEKHKFTSPAPNYTIYTSGMVDLGLSVKWSACNLGASFPAEFGTAAGWGDPTGNLNSENQNDYGGAYPAQNISGTSLDICTRKMGSAYRTPTLSEYNELVEKCVWRFTEWRGQTGWIAVGRNGNAIFIPCTDKDGYYTRYWTASFSSANNLGILMAISYGVNNKPHAYAAKRSDKGCFRPVSRY